MGWFYDRVDETTGVLCCLAVILFAGFLMTRLTKKLKLPNVSGYILAGILIGPGVLKLIPESVLSHMGFVCDIALAFIAFKVGSFFKRDVVRQTGAKVLFITLCEALLAGLAVTLGMRVIFKLSWEFSLILGAIATATAPASTMMTIKQYGAKGNFVNVLLQVVALDDVVCLLTFSVVVAVVNARMEGQFSIASVLIPLLMNALTVALGALCGRLLTRLLSCPSRSKDNRLILTVAMLLGLSGICSAMGVSPLLACMVFGAVYINRTEDEQLYEQVDHFSPPIMSMFFIISGMNLDLSTIGTAGVMGASYFLIRILGKYGGMVLGCKAAGMPKDIRNYMGLALIPQAGVSIGLAFLGQRLLPEALGDVLLTVILASSVLYELIGPLCAKLSLILSGVIPRESAARAIEEPAASPSDSGADPDGPGADPSNSAA